METKQITVPEKYRNRSGEEFEYVIHRHTLTPEHDYWLYTIQAKHNKWGFQLLLPLSITDDNTADVALVAEKDTPRKKYMVRTILTMDMAYLDARIICAPDRQWLNP